MSNLYTLQGKTQSQGLDLSSEDVSSIIYHDLFDYPLNFGELIKWKAGKLALHSTTNKDVKMSKGFYFVEGREGLVYKRLLRARISDKKIAIAKKVSKILSFIPFIKMMGVTGSLAMKNSEENGDIDLLIVTKKNYLWTTRAITLLTLNFLGISTRRFADKNQKDKLCLNMWMDESDLIWKPKNRNVYSAHEIAQIVPLINKDKTYEKLLKDNSWIVNFWPNAVRINKKVKKDNKKAKSSFIENFFFDLQYQYMKKKISRETVTKTRALFHPQDWSKVVLKRLG